MSLLLRPSLPPDVIPRITYVAALSLAQALSRWVPERDLEIKWPNDLLLGGKKVAGILLETRMEAARAEHVIVGVGVNVGGTAADFAPDVRDLATTLAEHARNDAPPPTVLDVFLEFLACFETAYERFVAEGFGPLRPEWNRWFRMAGRRIRVSGGATPVDGEVVELTEQGALLVRDAGGELRRILAGDVAFVTTKPILDKETGT